MHLLAETSTGFDGIERCGTEVVTKSAALDAGANLAVEAAPGVWRLVAPSLPEYRTAYILYIFENIVCMAAHLRRWESL